jgi:lipopolysaccharide transport system permease protein
MSIQEETLTVNAFDLSESTTLDENVVFEPVDQTILAWRDVTDSLRKWPIWTMLSYNDIKIRYRRSVLGPFWLTLSMAITIYTMGYVYAHIFHMQMANYFPYLASGMLAWTLLSSIVLEFTEGFSVSENLIKQIKLPFLLYMHRIACRNLIIFMHNIVVIIPILIFYHATTPVNLNTLLLFPNLFLIYINTITFGLMLAMVGARFRDISQIIRSLIQIVFFVTPVMWKPELMTGNNRLIVDLNPFYSLIELIRAPLIGTVPSFYNYAYVFGMTLVGITLSWKLFVSRRARIIYWI